MSFYPLPLTLTARHAETVDCESFYFTAKSVPFFSFKPGQYALLAVTIDDKTYVRAYSMSSQPNSPILRLTIKRAPQGIVSNWLIDHLKPGQQVTLNGFAGDFNIIDHPFRRKVLFISAGCGITPVMSMTEYLLKQANPPAIEFLHCAKDEHNVIFHQQLMELAHEFTTFNYHLRLKSCTSDQPHSTRSVGRITSAFIDAHYPQLAKEYTLFVCGSGKFTAELKQLLVEQAFDMAHFHHEYFTISSTANDDNLATPSAVTVQVPAFNINQTAQLEDTLLDVLSSAQLPIIAACRAGVCGACKCKVEQGDVSSDNMLALTQEEIAQGYRLACVGKIKSDVEISLI
ncbi:iron-sulfur cluster-binding domain-containing protein [Utexia brackfieldae]|uniref:flavin reductase family protein n=1 Tax=Utexia brackfieldae TaxID=3074108 RepID=UPI00370D79EF